MRNDAYATVYFVFHYFREVRQELSVLMEEVIEYLVKNMFIVCVLEINCAIMLLRRLQYNVSVYIQVERYIHFFFLF